MKTNTLLKLPALLFGVTIFLFSCNLDSENFIPEADLSLLEDEFEINTVLEDLDNISLNAMESSGLGLRVMNSSNGSLCSTAKINHEASAKKITVDFGTGCTGPNGIIRKGKVIFNYTGSFLLPGSSVTTTFEGYEVNGLKLEGTRIMTNIGVNLQAQEISFTVNIQNGKVTWSDGKVSTFSADQVRKITLGSSGYQVSVTGKGTGKTRGGTSYTAEITEPLIVTQACLESGISVPNKGKVTLSFTLFSATVDYGTGECDKKLNVSYPGGVKEITLD